MLPLRHRGCLSDITGALFCSPGAICGWFLVSTPFECCFYRPFACFCHKMTFYFGGYDHCVLYTTAQLTEGRSARDQPKQPPAKKAREGAHKFIYTRLNTEVVDCCRIYHLPPTSSATTPPPASASHAPGPSNPMPAPALNVRPRLLAESSSRSRTPPGPSAPSLFDYDTDFPHPIGALPKGKGKGKGGGKGKGKGKRKGKDTPSEASPPDSPRESKGKGTGKTK